jgi:hypothetical protein
MPDRIYMRCARMSFAASVRTIAADYCKSEKSISTLSLITSDSPELFFDVFDLITFTPELLDLLLDLLLDVLLLSLLDALLPVVLDVLLLTLVLLEALLPTLLDVLLLTLVLLEALLPSRLDVLLLSELPADFEAVLFLPESDFVSAFATVVASTPEASALVSATVAFSVAAAADFPAAVFSA